MKFFDYLKRLIPFSFYALAILFVASCSSDGSEDVVQDEFLIATVGTSSFEARNNPGEITVSILSSQLLDSDTIFTLQGFDDDVSIMAVLISDYTGPGTYDLSFNTNQEDTENTRLAQFSDNVSDIVFRTDFGEAGTGSITIVEESEDVISGTFEFVGVDLDTGNELVVTNGSFRAFIDNDTPEEDQ